MEETEKEEGNVYIQYKGTDLCADLHCDCGEHLHVDSFNAYAVKCEHCGAIWELPQTVTAIKVESSVFEPLLLSNGEDWD